MHPAGSPFKRSLIGNIIDSCCKLPPSSIHLHHVTPTLNENELYINKQKIVLFDDESVQRHHLHTHSMHICSNSPLIGNGHRGETNGLSANIQMTKVDESKYDQCSESKSTQNEKSESRKDENANQDDLYSYDEDEDEEENENVSVSNQFQLNENILSTTPEPIKNLGVKMTKNDKSRSSPNHSQTSVPSESPVSVQEHNDVDVSE